MPLQSFMAIWRKMKDICSYLVLAVPAAPQSCWCRLACVFPMFRRSDGQALQSQCASYTCTHLRKFWLSVELLIRVFITHFPSSLPSLFHSFRSSCWPLRLVRLHGDSGQLLFLLCSYLDHLDLPFSVFLYLFFFVILLVHLCSTFPYLVVYLLIYLFLFHFDSSWSIIFYPFVSVSWSISIIVDRSVAFWLISGTSLGQGEGIIWYSHVR
jgi:hypothetical protein